MTESYKRANYQLRPAKHAERMMMCDVFRRLKFGSVESYQYVGLGSVYFADFALFHRALGFVRMVNIEDDPGDDAEKRRRFDDNRPFAGIEMLWGNTETELPKVNLGLRSIAWLDYDNRLSKAIINDIRNFTQRVVSGSVLVVSVQCNSGQPDGTEPRKLVSRLEVELGEEFVSPDLVDAELVGWGQAGVYRSAIVSCIEETLARRNGILPPGQKMRFEQIMHFVYKDGLRMVTIGGVFFDEGQKAMFDQCQFPELDFYRSGTDYFHVDMPFLTKAELRHVERQMPSSLEVPMDCGSIPAAEAKKYARLYRYFPNYATVDL